MKQVVQNYKSGELALVDVPAPACKPGGVLVRTRYSLISVGTEMMKVGEAKLSLLGKAKARPDQVRKVMATASQQGLKATWEKVNNKLDSYTPLGYSLCGVVEAVGAGAEEFKVGDVVACAGNQHALHAEVNWVPVNLCVPVPPGVDPRHAAFTTVGAIAMQGLRQGEVQLGDVAVVIGLGLVGQLLVQLLVASGVRVVGLDPDGDRGALAQKLGALAAGSPSGDGLDAVVAALAQASGGHGADQVFLTAGGDTNQPVELAAELARDRARVVDIGKCSLDLPWNSYYDKELDVRFSRSYGPGRYDDRYELEGHDYPIGYVRWTERRNLACFVDLLGAGRLDLEPLVSHVAPFGDAVQTYEAMDAGRLRGVGFLFEYGEDPDASRTILAPPPDADGATPVVSGPRRPFAASVLPRPFAASVLPRPFAASVLPRPFAASAPAVPAGRPLRLGFVGAGSYASSMLLPHLTGRSDVALATVATTSSLSAANAQRKFGFAAASTDVDALLADESIDAVFVVTRHRTHPAFAVRALEAGKAVFVEKPLALDEDGLAAVLDAVARTGNDRIAVGFNRRFSPLLGELKQKTGRRSGPAVVRYLVNTGKLDKQSWYRDGAEGSRFDGEGGHFIDTASWWLGSDPVEVMAMATPDDTDNVHVALRYPDGSLATIDYLTNGSVRFPKETFESLADGRVARLDNFAKARVWSGRRGWRTRARGVDKGQKAELDAFLTAVRSGGPMPISLDSIVATTRATLAVARSLQAGRPVPVQP